MTANRIRGGNFESWHTEWRRTTQRTEAALRRGYNCLTFEGPGYGEPLRLNDLLARPDYEVPFRAALDYLIAQPEVDPEPIALSGTSLGGYSAVRAAAFDPRIKALIIHCALYDLLRTQTSARPALAPFVHLKSPRVVEAIMPVAERFYTEMRWYIANGRWVFGAPSGFELLQAMGRYTLADAAGLIRCPKTLFVCSVAEGAEERCQIRNLRLMQQIIFDWLAEVWGDEPAVAGGSLA